MSRAIKQSARSWKELIEIICCAPSNLTYILPMTLKEQMHAAYLDYVNNFLTVEKFAEHYGISYMIASQMINEMREYHEFLCEIEKAKNARLAGNN